MAGLVFALGLLLLLILIGVAFMWQGSIRFPGAPVAYGVEESIKYITPRLAESTRAVIGPKSVRRILEWEMKYLQDQLVADPDQPVVLGGEAVASYVLQQTSRQGFAYDPAVVAEVMQLQAEYMASIGALDRPVTEDEMKSLGLDNG
jgi:hypothetical protein